MIDRETVLAYVRDLRQTLLEGSLMQGRMFLRKLPESIEVKSHDVTVAYTRPQPRVQTALGGEKVLGLLNCGGPGWDRTSDQSVMSRSLYH